MPPESNLQHPLCFACDALVQRVDRPSTVRSWARDETLELGKDTIPLALGAPQAFDAALVCLRHGSQHMAELGHRWRAP